jgi:hypothetical protein
MYTVTLPEEALAVDGPLSDVVPHSVRNPVLRPPCRIRERVTAASDSIMYRRASLALGSRILAAGRELREVTVYIYPETVRTPSV